MDNIHFSAATIVGALLEGCLAVLLPVVLIVVWKLKTKAKLVPFWVGCAIFPLFALVLEAIAATVITLIDYFALRKAANRLKESASTRRGKQ